MKSSVPSGFLLALLLLGVVGASAQDSSLSRRESGPASSLIIPRGPAARLAAGSGEASQPDPAAGPDLYGDQEVLARPPLWQPWTFSAAAGGEWQNNAALAPNRSEEDYVFRQSASARYTRKLSDSWYADFGAAQQIARYDKFDILDYDRVDADAGILWITPPEWSPLFRNWILSGRLAWYRLSEASSFNTELFTNTAFAGSLIRSFPLHRHHNLLFGLSGEVSIDSTADEVERNEYAALAAWQAAWSPRWETTLLARAAFYDYNRHDDLNLTGSLSIDYVVGKNLRVGVIGSWTQNLSSEPVFEYRNASAGAALRLQFRF